MKIIVVEDERPIANYIKKVCEDILGKRLDSIEVFYTLDEAGEYIADNKIDVCLLDLNLNGEDGYEILKQATAAPFQTIVISANTDKAIEAYQYGVLDFVPKPFDDNRLCLAFERYSERVKKSEVEIKYLSFRKGSLNSVILVEEVEFFKAAGVYVEAHLKNGNMEILDKTMNRLEELLPSFFVRIHRSYFVNISRIKSYRHLGGGAYQVTTKNDHILSLSRQKYKELHDILNY